MRKVLGIIGGIGAGKSAVTEILQEEFNALIIRTDEVGHDLQSPGTAVYKELLNLLGSDVLKPDGMIDKQKMSDRIFSDALLLDQINMLVHPAVWEEVNRQISAAGEHLIVVETALPMKEFRDICDEIWYVYTSEETRIARLMEDRGYSIKKCHDIMDSQKNDQWFKEHCDYVIDNSTSIEYLREQIRDILKKDV